MRLPRPAITKYRGRQEFLRFACGNCRAVARKPNVLYLVLLLARFNQCYARFSLVYGSCLSCATMTLASSRYREEWPAEHNDSFDMLFAFFRKANDNP